MQSSSFIVDLVFLYLLIFLSLRNIALNKKAEDKEIESLRHFPVMHTSLWLNSRKENLSLLSKVGVTRRNPHKRVTGDPKQLSVAQCERKTTKTFSICGRELFKNQRSIILWPKNIYIYDLYI